MPSSSGLACGITNSYVSSLTLVPTFFNSTLSLNHLTVGCGLADETTVKRNSLPRGHSWSVKPFEIVGAAVTFNLNVASVDPIGFSSLQVIGPLWSTRAFLAVITRRWLAASNVCSIPSLGVNGFPSRNKVIVGNGKLSISHSIVAVSPCLTVLSVGLERNSGDS